MKYFKNIKNEDQAKKKYFELSQKLHPDKAGGSQRKFQAMKKEYEDLLIYFKVNKSLDLKRPENKQKIKISKEHAAEIQDKAASLTATITKTAINGLFSKYFDVK